MTTINASVLSSAMMGGNKFREGWSARTTVSEQRRALREFYRLCDRAVARAQEIEGRIDPDFFKVEYVHMRYSLKEIETSADSAERAALGFVSIGDLITDNQKVFRTFEDEIVERYSLGRIITYSNSGFVARVTILKDGTILKSNNWKEWGDTYDVDDRTVRILDWDD